MKLRELESLLQDVRPFEQAKVELEQYPTGPHLAAAMLWTIQNTHDALEGKTVIDLGSGTGMLSIGSALLGAGHVLGLELDPDAIEVALDNTEQFEDPLPVDFVQCDVLELLGVEADAVEGTEIDSRHGKGRRGGRRAEGRQRGRQRPARGDRRHRQQSEEDDDSGEAEEDTASGGDEGVDEHGSAGGSDPEHSKLHTGEHALSSQTQQGASNTRATQCVGSGDPAGPASSLQTSTSQAAWHAELLERLQADTVVMNPPFGTKQNKGIDMQFLKAAFRVCRPGGCVYSLHKSSTRSHIQMVATKQLGAQDARVVAELRYDLPATMKFHKQKSVDIQVDLWRMQLGVLT